VVEVEDVNKIGDIYRIIFLYMYLYMWQGKIEQCRREYVMNSITNSIEKTLTGSS